VTGAQLELGLRPRPVPPVRSPDMPDLALRLRAAGIAPSRPITLHRNRRVMVSMDRTGGLRVHAGYGWAPDDVLAALVTWATPRARARDRRAAARIFIGFPVHDYVPPPPRRRAPVEALAPGDPARLAKLRAQHQVLNLRWFAGRLAPIEIRLSGRMRRKLGHYEPRSAGTPAITISRRHLRRDGWEEVVDTLLHEMVHQWQDETGLPVDHGRAFRRKAAEVGIEPSAIRRPGFRAGG
jgi:SprT-like family protein